jgi:hypothetical protein
MVNNELATIINSLRLLKAYALVMSALLIVHGFPHSRERPRNRDSRIIRRSGLCLWTQPASSDPAEEEI